MGYSKVARHFESSKLAVGQRLLLMYADAAEAAADILGSGGGGDETGAAGRRAPGLGV
jgi:hypothetical protein